MSAQVMPPFSASLFFHFEQVLVAYPLVVAVITLAVLMKAIQNKLLFLVSFGYAGLYFLTISWIATWFDDLGGELHYLFPLAFFFSGMIAAIAYKKLRFIVWGFCILQTLVFFYTLYLLSIPTTFNQADTYIERNFEHEHALILNYVVELSLPMNKETSTLLSDQYCGSKCLYWRTAVDVSYFIPAVVTWQSDISKVDVDSYSRALLVTDQKPESCVSEPPKIFQSGASDERYVSVEYNLGYYFVSDFWHLSRLGKNLALYEVSKECATHLLVNLNK